MRLHLIHNPDAAANRLHVNPADLDQAENEIEHSVLVRAAPVVGGRDSVMEVRADPAVPRGKAACSANTRVNLLAHDNDEIRLEHVESVGLQAMMLQPVGRVLTDAEVGMLPGVLRRQATFPIARKDQIFLTLGEERVSFIVSKSQPAYGWFDPEYTKFAVRNKVSRSALMDGPAVSFDDIGGLDATIEELRELVIGPWLHPEVWQAAGQNPSRGILLHGPPGTGKTMLAKATAREVGAKFHHLCAADLLSGTYGETEQRLKSIFANARREGPSLIFIDEIDSIGTKREDTRGELEKRVLTLLLELLDGFEDRGDVVVMAATNRMDVLDEALVRGGRLEVHIKVPYPDQPAREKILNIHTRDMPLNEVNLGEVALLTNGYTGADLATLCRTSARMAIRRAFGLEYTNEEGPVSEEQLNQFNIVMEDIEAARSHLLPRLVRDRRACAFHDVTLDDVVGHDAAKQVLISHLHRPISHPEIFSEFGLEVAGGLLLHGPPGTGKTMLAKAAAHASGVHFMHVQSSDLLSKWVGESERNVSRLFDDAELLAPVVMFFDEFDALGRRREGSESGVHHESVSSLLLSLMDGSKTRDGVFIMAATNRLDMIDPAFLRPGRIEHIVEIGPLAQQQYVEFMRRDLDRMPAPTLIDDDELHTIAQGLRDRLTGAELAMLMRSARHEAARRCILNPDLQPLLTLEDLQQACVHHTTFAADQFRSEYDPDAWMEGLE